MPVLQVNVDVDKANGLAVLLSTVHTGGIGRP